MTAPPVNRLGYALGAEIRNVDTATPLPERVIATIREAWREHIVLCLPDQELTADAFERFCAQFGDLDDNRALPHLRRPDHLTVMEIASSPVTVRDKTFESTVTDHWHTDQSYTTRPSTATFLHAKQLPEVGGDTMFANMYMAYETLSPAFQRLIQPLAAVHDATHSAGYRRRSPDAQEEMKRQNPPVVHPIVQVHPETGRKSLYLGHRIRNFVGMTEEETLPLLHFLTKHATRYEFVYRHRWSLRDIIMWDNRCALHYAVPDYDRSQLRWMQRCTLLGPQTGSLLQESQETVSSTP